MDDYYALLGLDRSATVEEIAKKIRHEIGLWSKRTSNSSDLSRQQEAERRVQLLGEAKATLLDDASRREYDQRLAAAPPRAAASVRAEDGANWLDLARRALAKNDYNSALYAAREARTAGMAASEVWSVMARANAGLNRLDDALYESQQAVLLDSGNPDTHMDLGGVHEARESWSAAYSAFEAAHRLIPAADGPRLAMAQALGEQGRHREAIESMEKLYAACQDREQVGAQFAMLLARSAEAVPQVRYGDEYFITSRAEITSMRQLLDRAKAVTSDPFALAAVAEVETYVDKCASKPFAVARFLTRPLFWIGVFMLLVTLCVAQGSPSGGFVTFLIAGALIFGAVAQSRTPVWKINHYNHVINRAVSVQR